MSANENENVNTLEIDIGKLLLACLKKWWCFVIAMVLCGAIVYASTILFVSPTYQATVKIYVNNKDIVSSSSVTTSDITASAKLVELYSVILNTRDTLDRIIQQNNLNYTTGQLKDMLATSGVNDTQVFSVTVTTTSPGESLAIAQTVGEILPEEIKEIISGADAKVIEHAVLPTQRSGPNYVRNAILGALIGFVITAIAIAVMTILDTTVESEQDIRDITDVPILVHIPDLKANVSNQKKYQAYARTTKTE